MTPGKMSPLRVSRGRERERAGMFMNITNHPSTGWPEEQTKAALALADGILDIPFPNVPPAATLAEVEGMALDIAHQVPAGAVYALVQGEFTLAFELVRRLQARGIICLAATTERRVEVAPDGAKTSTFRFVQFREYPELDPIMNLAGSEAPILQD
jgi:hypothetical protein